MNGDMADGPIPDLCDLETILAFHMESGVDWVLDETPHDRFAERDLKAQRFSIGACQQDAPVAPAEDLRRSGTHADAAGDEAATATHARPQISGDVAAWPTASAPAATTGSAPARPPGTPPAPQPSSTPAFASAADDVALQAGALARAATTLAELEAAMEQFDGCSLKRTARQLVFADGAPDARIMFVGEAPGAEEDRIGRPFVGRSGQLLDRMLAAIGLDRTNVYIANTTPWRPPGNRAPTPQESAICRPFLERQIALVNPDILVCLGGPSAQSLLGVREGILRIRGRWTSYSAGERQIRAIPTLHPAYLLRSPLQKRLAWRDLRTIRAALDELPAGK